MRKSSSLNTSPSIDKRATFKPNDVLSLNEIDPEFSYRWISTKNLASNGWSDHRGYSVVNTITNMDYSPTAFSSLEKREGLDGIKRSGDLVLGRMPKEQANLRKEYYKRKAQMHQEFLRAKDDKIKFNGMISGMYKSQSRDGTEEERI